MNFKDILNFKNNPYEVYLGHIDNIIEKVNLKDYPSMIITGSTGTSKSVFLHEILLQLISNNISDDLKIITINPTKVELKPYRETIYSYHKDISLVSNNIDEIVNILNTRIDLFKENGVTNFDEYNNLEGKNIPLLVIAIDEATELLKEKNSEEKLRWIINNCKDTGIIFIMTTSNIYNKFFTIGYNTLASIRISFDYVCDEDSKMTNLSNCNNLKKDEFLIEINHLYTQKKCNNFYFEDSIIEEILSKKRY